MAPKNPRVRDLEDGGCDMVAGTVGYRADYLRCKEIEIGEGRQVTDQIRVGMQRTCVWLTERKVVTNPRTM